MFTCDNDGIRLMKITFDFSGQFALNVYNYRVDLEAVCFSLIFCFKLCASVVHLSQVNGSNWCDKPVAMFRHLLYK